MNLKMLGFGFLCAMAPVSFTYAHEIHARETEDVKFVLASLEGSKIKIYEKDGKRVIESNGIPNHETGQFPNRQNPNSISAQKHVYTVPLNPKKNMLSTALKRQPFGIAINGVPLDPGTAECFGQARGQRPSGVCAWSVEAIVGGLGQLGLDEHNAHVQPNGAYHYHGYPKGIERMFPITGDLIPIGYAADGFKIVAIKTEAYKPSYVLKSGVRPNGPGGSYTGKYTQDFEFSLGSGDLDDCNGTMINGEYMYVITKTFPYIPRCFKGTPDESFNRHSATERLNVDDRFRRPPPHHRRGMF